MSKVIQILIATYPNPDAAETALKKLHTAQQNQGIEVHDAAVVQRAENGKLKIHETEDITGGSGAAIGGILGGILGILAGPAGIIAGAAVGAAVGGATASIIDTGIPHKRLEEIGAALPTHGAALVILAEEGYVQFIETLLGGESTEFLIEAMDAAAAEKIKHDHEVAVNALKLGDALAEGGMASPTDAE